MSDHLIPPERLRPPSGRKGRLGRPRPANDFVGDDDLADDYEIESSPQGHTLYARRAGGREFIATYPSRIEAEDKATEFARFDSERLKQLHMERAENDKAQRLAARKAEVDRQRAKAAENKGKRPHIWWRKPGE